MLSSDRRQARPLAAGALLISAVLAMVGIAAPAHAASGPPEVEGVASPLTNQALDALRADLSTSGASRTTSIVDGAHVDIFTIAPGTTIAVPRETDSPQARLGVGLDGFRPWVTLNRTDQGAIKNGGSAAIGVTICALSGGNVLICGGVAVALAVAFTYINAHNICPTSKPQLKLYVGGNAAAQCVK